MITNLWKPTKGTVELFGKTLETTSYEVLKRMGSIIEFPTFYEHMSGKDNLQLHCEYMGYYNKGSIDEVLEMLNLREAANKPVKSYSLGMKQRLGIARTIKLSVAYGTKRTILYYTKAITILVVSLITYLIFVATFFVIEIIQSGYIPTASEVINLLGWALACGTVLLALESISIFLCVVIQNTGIVTGICCSGASVYLMLWSDMETVSIPLKFFVYGNPMYYWMNFSSCRTMGIIEHLPFYFIGCISLLIVGGLIMIRKEIK